MIRRVSIPAFAFGALAPADNPEIGVVILAQAVDARLWAAPLGTTAPVGAEPWTDCGAVGWDGAGDESGTSQVSDRFALAVQRAWAESWADG